MRFLRDFRRGYAVRKHGGKASNGGRESSASRTRFPGLRCGACRILGRWIECSRD